jgi:hypothetical protein
MALRIPGVVATDAETRFQRKKARDIREFSNGEGTDDDWSPVVQAAVDAVDTTLEDVALPAQRMFINSPITINDPIGIHGVPHGTHLVAGDDLGDAMIIATTAGGHPTEGQHLASLRISGLFLDGNGRSVDAGGIRLAKVQRAIVEDVKIRHFTRPALHFSSSVRNSRFCRVWAKHCGDSFNGWAQFQIENPTGSPDSPNLNVFSECESVYPAGHHLWIKTDRTGAQTRQHWFEGTTFHSAPPTLTTESIDGYTITFDDRYLASGIVLQHAASQYFFDCDFEYASYGFPQISIQNNVDQASGTSNEVTVGEGCVFGSQEHYDATVTAIDTTTNVITFSAHKFPTDAVVRVSSLGTLPGGISANTDYYVRRISGTTLTLHTTWENARKNVSPVDITSAGSGTITVSSQEIAILADRISYLSVNARFHGTTNRPKVVNKHLANRVRFGGAVRSIGATVLPYEGPDSTDLLADWRGADIAADALRIVSPDGTVWRVSVDDSGVVSAAEVS